MTMEKQKQQFEDVPPILENVDSPASHVHLLEGML